MEPAKRKVEQSVSSKRQQLEQDEFLTSAPPVHLLCSLTHALLVDPVLSPQGFTYSRAPLEQYIAEHGKEPRTGIPLKSSQLYPNAAVSEALNKWQAFAAQHEDSFICLLCHDALIDPVTLGCCGRNICQQCIESARKAQGTATLPCPLCRRVLPQRQSINTELAALLSLHFGNERLEKERQSRESVQQSSRKLEQQAKLYLGSERRLTLQRSMELVLDELRVDGAFCNLKRVKKLVETYFLEACAETTPLRDWELDFALRTSRYLYCNLQRWGDSTLMRIEDNALGNAIINADGEITIAELAEEGWLTSLCIQELQEEGTSIETLQKFMLHNRLPNAEKATAWPRSLGWIDSHSRTTHLMGFIEQLKPDDYSAQSANPDEDSLESSESD